MMISIKSNRSKQRDQVLGAPCAVGAPCAIGFVPTTTPRAMLVDVESLDQVPSCTMEEELEFKVRHLCITGAPVWGI